MSAEQLRRQVLIRKLYLKSLKLTTYQDRETFAADLDAERLLNIRSTNSAIDDEQVEVTLNVAVKTVAQEDTIYQIEVAQAGVFEVIGYTQEERIEILGRVCPEILFPYARSIMTDVVRRGGFSDVLLNPLDFRALFAQNMRERSSQPEAN